MSDEAWSARLGAVVRQHRRLAGLTQVELAQMAGVGKTVVHDLEKGKPTIQLDTVLKIVAALNIRLFWKTPTEDAPHA